MENVDVQEAISRAVVTLVDPEGVFARKLEAKAQGKYRGDIVIKLGVDPTRPDIHLGHAVILRKLRKFQDLGAKVVFLVGDVTAQIGDPTGKSKVRPEISGEEVRRNMQTFLEQVGRILRTDPEAFVWTTNSEWFTNVTDIAAGKDTKVEIDGKPVDPNSFLGKAVLYENTRMQKTLGKTQFTVVSLIQFLSTLKHITHARLIERDMFQDRLKRGDELYMHEMMYPVLQGLDSLAIAQVFGACDLEIGGTDQTFNMLMGRDVMKMANLEPQAVMALEILPGLDGKEKMSKSLNNYIAITDAPNDMFGKVMSVPDALIPTYFRLATYTPLEEAAEIEKRLAKGQDHPRDLKLRLAHEIVSIYHGEEAARKAEKSFVETFSKGGVPTDVDTVKAAAGEKLVDILLSQKMIESKSEWRRLVDDGAVTDAETGDKIASPDAALERPLILRVGKKRFIKIDTL